MTSLVKTGVERSIQTCMVLVAAIHVAPLIGALGSDRLSAL
jgi:hypothetical protein